MADITHGVADFLHGAAVILRSMAIILSNVPDILHVQHKCLGVFKGKNTLFLKKAKKIGQVAKILFRGEGVRSISDNYHLFIFLDLLL